MQVGPSEIGDLYFSDVHGDWAVSFRGGPTRPDAHELQSATAPGVVEIPGSRPEPADDCGAS